MFNRNMLMLYRFMPSQSMSESLMTLEMHRLSKSLIDILYFPLLAYKQKYICPLYSRDNFLEVHVFYEDLGVEQVKEKENYSVSIIVG